VIGYLALVLGVVAGAAVGYRATGSRRGAPPSRAELRWFEVLGRYAPYDSVREPAPDDDPAFQAAAPRSEP
jgi:hypothetical protein